MRKIFLWTWVLYSAVVTLAAMTVSSAFSGKTDGFGKPWEIFLLTGLYGLPYVVAISLALYGLKYLITNNISIKRKRKKS